MAGVNELGELGELGKLGELGELGDAPPASAQNVGYLKTPINTITSQRGLHLKYGCVWISSAMRASNM